VTALRQPILSLLGHVDHGKTTLLDRIAGSVRAATEAGGITQHIGAIEVPRATVLRICEGLIKPEQFQVPGLLIIDTPGHRSFATMRRRGGALADLAILVVDAQEGVMPQTRESIQILRHEKTPFVVALTKIDLVPGWRKPTSTVHLLTHLKYCGEAYERALDQKLYAVAEDLVGLGFSADRFDRVSDFARNVGIVPVSARSGVGVAEVLAVLVGLSQRFLSEELLLVTEGGEATILERSEHRGIGAVASIIVYRGRLRVGEEIAVTGRTAPFTTRVRGLYRPTGKITGRNPSRAPLAPFEEVTAAAGLFLSAPGLEEAVPGGILKVVRSDAEREQVNAELAQEIQPVTELEESGIGLAADTLGSLEALAFECREAKLPVHVAEVGPVNRPMVLKVAAVREPTHRAILAFNVPTLPDAVPPSASSPITIFPGDVMYRLLEQYSEWRTERTQQLSVERREESAHPAKFQFLPGFVFHSSKPAIIGIRVLAGELRPGVRVMRADGTEVGLLKSLQKAGASVKVAEESSELAASIDGAVVGRTLTEGDLLYVAVPESVARILDRKSLTESERRVFDEMLRIRRMKSPFWGA
jgi:translation initiation factor 5B